MDSVAAPLDFRQPEPKPARVRRVAVVLLRNYFDEDGNKIAKGTRCKLKRADAHKLMGAGHARPDLGEDDDD